MSYIGFFESSINNYFNCKNKTKKIINEAKVLIRQFETSEYYEDFEDLEKYEILKAQIKRIYNEVYN